MAWCPRKPEQEPGLFVWRESGVPDELPPALRSAGQPRRASLLIPRTSADGETKLESTHVVGRFVLGLLARGRIAPTLEEGRARWRPFFSSDVDRRALHALLHAMPPS